MPHSGPRRACAAVNRASLGIEYRHFGYFSHFDQLGQTSHLFLAIPLCLVAWSHQAQVNRRRQTGSAHDHAHHHDLIAHRV